MAPFRNYASDWLDSCWINEGETCKSPLNGRSAQTLTHGPHHPVDWSRYGEVVRSLEEVQTALVRELLGVLGACPAGTLHKVVLLPAGAAATAVQGVDVTLVDNEGHAYNAYPPATQGFSVIIVRPDGVVGAVVRGAEGAKRYLDGIFADH